MVKFEVRVKRIYIFEPFGWPHMYVPQLYFHETMGATI